MDAGACQYGFAARPSRRRSIECDKSRSRGSGGALKPLRPGRTLRARRSGSSCLSLGSRRAWRSSGAGRSGRSGGARRAGGALKSSGSSRSLRSDCPLRPSGPGGPRRAGGSGGALRASGAGGALRSSGSGCSGGSLRSDRTRRARRTLRSRRAFIPSVSNRGIELRRGPVVRDEQQAVRRVRNADREPRHDVGRRRRLNREHRSPEDQPGLLDPEVSSVNKKKREIRICIDFLDLDL